MKISQKIPSIIMRLASLLVAFSMSFFVNAAKYDIQEDFFQEETKISKGFSYNDLVKFNPLQVLDNVKANYRTVLNLIQQKKIKQAKEKIDLLIRLDPKQALYFNLKAVLELKEKNFDLAALSYKHSIDLEPVNVQAYLGLSAIALGEKQFSRVLQYVNKALAYNPSNGSAYVILAKLAMHGVDVAEKQLLDAHKSVKGDLNAELVILQLLGQVYESNKQPERILSLAEDLVERSDGDILALSFLARMQLVNQNESVVEEILRKMIVLEPRDVNNRLLLVRMLIMQEGRDTEILQLLDQAVVNSENSGKVLAIKVAFLIKREKYKQALLIAKQIDEANPALSVGKIAKGDVYLAEKKYDKALGLYQQSYQIDKNIKVLRLILNIFVVQNTQQKAIDLLETELAQNEANTFIRTGLANLYQKSGQFDLAAKHYEVLLAKQKGNVIILNNLAWAYGQQGNPKALEMAERSFKIAPESGDVADTYGYILLKNGKKQEALRILERADKIAPESGGIQLHLAEAYIANQKKVRAREILQSLINKNGVEKVEANKLMDGL